MDIYENILEGKPLLYTEGKDTGEEEDTDHQIVNVSILRIS